MSWFHLCSKEDDRGEYLIWRCPQCDAERHFNMVTRQLRASVFFILPLGSPCITSDLRCRQCSYLLDVPESELPAAEELKDYTQQFIAGKLTRSDYTEKIRTMPVKFIKNLLALTEENPCPQCGESNPLNFDTCWNCRRPLRAKQEPAGTGEKPFPDIPSGGNPWEM